MNNDSGKVGIGPVSLGATGLPSYAIVLILLIVAWLLYRIVRAATGVLDVVEKPFSGEFWEDIGGAVGEYFTYKDNEGVRIYADTAQWIEHQARGSYGQQDPFSAGMLANTCARRGLPTRGLTVEQLVGLAASGRRVDWDGHVIGETSLNSEAYPSYAVDGNGGRTFFDQGLGIAQLEDSGSVWSWG